MLGQRDSASLRLTPAFPLDTRPHFFVPGGYGHCTQTVLRQGCLIVSHAVVDAQSIPQGSLA